MNLYVIVNEELDDYDNLIYFQEVFCEDEPQVRYSVCNLTDCPEDAIIGRSLVSAEKYIKILELGMALGRKGYDYIVPTYN